jgi:uncharacterized protein YjbJ (UPF0337 family)
MNWDQVEGQWEEFKGTLKTKWAKLTDDDLLAISGNKDKLLGKLQKRYGLKRNQAESELEQWAKALDRDNMRH